MAFDPISGLFSAASGLFDNLFANRRQEDQQAFNAQQFATRYQTTVKDMQAAGLNPMLAYSQGGGAGASSGISSSSGSMTQAYSAYRENQRQQEMTDAQVGLLKAQTTKAEAEAEVARAYALPRGEAELNQILADTARSGAQTRATEASVGQILAQTSLIGQQTELSAAQVAQTQANTDNLVAQLKNIPKEGDRLVAAAKQLMSSAENLRQQSISEVDRRKVLVQQAAQIAKQADLLGFDVSAAEKFDNLGREAGQAKPFVDILKSVIGVLKR